MIFSIIIILICISIILIGIILFIRNLIRISKGNNCEDCSCCKKGDDCFSSHNHHLNNK